MSSGNILEPSKEEKSTTSGYYDSAMRWVEDTYLSWFGENRTSYGVKDSVAQTKVTGNKDVDGIQDSVGETVGNTFGKGGLLGGVGEGADKSVLRGSG
ncbi:hypothetical protein GLAREA_03756 [Glarea lozoyensis ATCC 20868]|uniref:Uncharacterized protein n=2 Tax=Glarea lozoyensis TaxID=101852 RepID=S3D0X9_GLAL2|nr:uncharacterized protein GLAREA_03756 [Glarea lozoyensis ATCC 20868]EHK96678.1 hypothetical protein M7I_7582 [Glarea lozoyensis 74030]EPE30789.1 hypothetical protein GLAREA_03756 [Glarea lozoyensis ATCC 20868]